MNLWDVIIIGGGPAGLSAALILGRCRRKVLLCDAGTPRNWAAHEMHGFLTRDRVTPTDFRALAHQELLLYDAVEFVAGEVTEVKRESDVAFQVKINGDRSERGRKLLVATGVVDELPPLTGIEQFWGRSVHQCPYCDGWELCDSPVAVYGKRARAMEMARAMTAWTADIALCTDGSSGLKPDQKEHLARNGVQLFEDRIDRLVGHNGQLEAIVFKSGRELPRRALFFDMPSYSQSPIAQQLGCQTTKKGAIRSGEYEATNVPGVFVAGNIIGDVQLSIVAAAEGARAAFGINRSLTREDFNRRATGVRDVDHPSVDDKEVARRRPHR